jgi:hypothetical protein
MRTSGWLVIVLRILATLLVAAPLWAVLGYLATAPLGAIYGWGGHPSIPSAPASVYVGLYLVVLPIVCLCLAWWVVGLIARLVTRVRPAGV